MAEQASGASEHQAGEIGGLGQLFGARHADRTPRCVEATRPTPEPDLDARYNHGHTRGMKTAVSLPDELFVKVEKTAERLGISRSRLFALALEEYLLERQPEEITRALNELYESEPSSVDAIVAGMQTASTRDESW